MDRHCIAAGTGLLVWGTWAIGALLTFDQMDSKIPRAMARACLWPLFAARHLPQVLREAFRSQS